MVQRELLPTGKAKHDLILNSMQGNVIIAVGIEDYKRVYKDFSFPNMAVIMQLYQSKEGYF